MFHNVFKIKNYKQLNTIFNTYNFFESSTELTKNEWIFNKVKDIAVYAQYNNPFYKNYYKEKKFDARELKSYNDLINIPIVNKEMLRIAGEKWSLNSASAKHGNTGGTSGKPLHFTYEFDEISKEYFFINKINKKIGCDLNHNILVFRGLNILGEKACIFHPESNTYLINTYKSLEIIKDDLTDFFRNNDIHFIRGYPSCIYEFSKFLNKEDNKDLLFLVKNKLKGILLGSEFPTNIYRKIINDTFLVPIIAWYGHSEMTILASEISDNIYEPFHTYGWCEAINFNNHNFHLIGTNLYNKLSPFIRYDTEDLIDPIFSIENRLEKFSISGGRLGEFIFDLNNNKISLTAFLFGRHHRIFEFVDFIQVIQIKPGFVKFVIVSEHKDLNSIDSLIDISNVDITFSYVIKDKPYRTPSGKIPLLVPINFLNED
jgi:phenylacetate-CoA ligase